MDFGRMLSRRLYRSCVAFGILFLGILGCTTVREVANLRKVRFQIERVSNVHLAGLDLSELRSFDDLSGSDVLRLTAAVSEGKLPLSFRLHLRATNPSSNDMNARLTRMEWTLLLEEKATVSGTFDREVVLPPGKPTSVPIRIDLNLVRFIDDNLQGLVDLALALSGDSPPQSIKLEVQPTIDTALGSFKYPSPITVVSEEVGRRTR